MAHLRLLLPLAVAAAAALHEAPPPAAAPAPDAPAGSGDALAARRWGEAGHRIVGEAAARALPADMPAFFREAVGQLAYLNAEPDRWRNRREAAPLDSAMDAAFSPDHLINMERVPPAALRVRDRYAYADSLRAAGVSPQSAGFLPWRILELTARLHEEFRLWRRASSPEERAWIEVRIVNDAGVLGHYVADAANPHHTTIHYNGWTGPNPKGYTPTGTGFHSRFESQYVEARLSVADVAPLVAPRPRTLLPLRDSVHAYLGRSQSQLDRLYELDKAERFDAKTNGAEHRRFAAERLAAGATMLRDVWWTAWTASATP